MKKRMLLFIVFALLVSLSLVGCSSETPKDEPQAQEKKQEKQYFRSEERRGGKECI